MPEQQDRDPLVTNRARSLLGQLAHVPAAEPSRRQLAELPADERRAVAIEGLYHENWRVRRTSAQLLDRVDLTPESIAALTRALDDEHPQVRRKAVHTLSCEHCKPNGCAVDVRALFGRVVGDPNVVVRSMVVHVCSLHFFDQQWAIDLVARVASSDPSAKLSADAGSAIRDLRRRWESDDRRRALPRDVVQKTDRHAGRWVAIRGDRIVAVANGQGRVFRREVKNGAETYWVPPIGVSRPQIP